MHTFTFQKRVNVQALHTALEDAFATAFIGVSTHDDDVALLFHERVDELALMAVLNTHDPNALTEAQQQQADREAAYAALQAQVEGVDLTQPLSAEDADVVARYNALRGLLGK